MTGFNLRKIKTSNSFEYPVKDDEGNPTGVVFTLAGPTHPVRRAADYAQRRKLIATAKQTGKVTVPDPEQQDTESAQYVARSVLGWTGYCDEAGLPVPHSEAAAIDLLTDPEMRWLLEQVERELGKAANFTRRV